MTERDKGEISEGILTLRGTIAHAEIRLEAGKRDETRARLQELGNELGLSARSVHQDYREALAAELEASEHDRAALAEARELLKCVCSGDLHYLERAQQWDKQAAVFLKRTEPSA